MLAHRSRGNQEALSTLGTQLALGPELTDEGCELGDLAAQPIPISGVRGPDHLRVGRGEALLSRGGAACEEGAGEEDSACPGERCTSRGEHSSLLPIPGPEYLAEACCTRGAAASRAGTLGEVSSSRRVRRAYVLACAALVLTALPSLAAPQAPTRGAEAVILVATPGVDPHELARALRGEGAVITHVYTDALTGLAGSLPAHLLVSLADDPRVGHIEADLPAHLQSTQQHPPWNLDRLDQRSPALNRSYRSVGGGRGVHAYVLDTGVRASHAELRGRVARGHSVIADGWGSQDCVGHGTHVAGTLGGRSTGVAKEVTIIPVRVFDCQGRTSTSKLLAGVEWVTRHHQSGQPAVANLSFQTPSSRALDAAVGRMGAEGVSAAAAAGNSGADACDQGLSRLPGVLTVAATTRHDARAKASNWGSCVEIFAPGERIVSAGHRSDIERVTSSGTSMATPHVAGAAVLLLAQKPSMTPRELSAVILENATEGAVSGARGSPNRLLFSHLTPDAGPVGAPGRPRGVQGLALPTTAGKADVSWEAPHSPSPITSSTIRIHLQGGKVSHTVEVRGAEMRGEVEGLPPGEYSFSVRSTNATGTGGWSARSTEVKVLR